MMSSVLKSPDPASTRTGGLIPADLAADYAACRRLAARHYENFTVASRLLPKPLRPHMAAVYAFCRGVDDLGDEYRGNRMAALDAWEAELDRAYRGQPTHPVFRALAFTVARYDLPREWFARLIAANRRDQEGRGYRTFAELRAYCALSADPVGRIVLALFGYRDSRRQEWSDAVCTGLQLANFLQDTARDLAQGRCYIPEEDLERFGCSPDDLERRPLDPRLRAMFAFQAERAWALLEKGRLLEASVPFRLRGQLAMYRLGGQAVLSALRRQSYDPFLGRPVLSAADKARIATRALVGALLGAG